MPINMTRRTTNRARRLRPSLLLFCASPRANHALRTLRPSEAASYARAHDQAVRETLQECLGGVPPVEAGLAARIAAGCSWRTRLCSQRSGRPRRRIGQHGWMRSPSSGLACPAQLIVAWLLWSKAQRAVCAKQRRRKTFYKEKAGKRAPAGTLPTKAPGRHSPAMQARANGLTAGSFTRRGLAIFTIATACHRLGPCYARKAGHTLVHGCQQCRANQHSPSPRRPCSWRCGAACVYPCRLAQTVAAPAPVVGSRSTSTGTMPCRAKIVERAWVRVARKAVGSDGQVIPQQWLVRTTAPGVQADDRRRLDLVVYFATPRGGALCCDATLVSPLARTGHPAAGSR